VQLDHRAVFGGVAADLVGGHAEPGAAQRVQRVPVDHALLQVGQVGGAGQVPRPAVRIGLGGPGQAQIGHAVGQLDREPVAARQGTGQGRGVGVPADGQPVRRYRERLSGDGRPVHPLAAGELDGQRAPVESASDDAGDRLPGQRPPQPPQYRGLC